VKGIFGYFIGMLMLISLNLGVDDRALLEEIMGKY
jgi:hypothetical protein